MVYHTYVSNIPYNVIACFRWISTTFYSPAADFPPFLSVDFDRFGSASFEAVAVHIVFLPKGSLFESGMLREFKSHSNKKWILSNIFYN